MIIVNHWMEEIKMSSRLINTGLAGLMTIGGAIATPTLAYAEPPQFSSNGVGRLHKPQDDRRFDALEAQVQELKAKHAPRKRSKAQRQRHLQRHVSDEDRQKWNDAAAATSGLETTINTRINVVLSGEDGQSGLLAPHYQKLEEINGAVLAIDESITQLETDMITRYDTLRSELQSHRANVTTQIYQRALGSELGEIVDLFERNDLLEMSVDRMEQGMLDLSRSYGQKFGDQDKVPEDQKADQIKLLTGLARDIAVTKTAIRNNYLEAHEAMDEISDRIGKNLNRTGNITFTASLGYGNTNGGSGIVEAGVGYSDRWFAVELGARVPFAGTANSSTSDINEPIGNYVERGTSTTDVEGGEDFSLQLKIGSPQLTLADYARVRGYAVVAADFGHETTTTNRETQLYNGDVALGNPHDVTGENQTSNEQFRFGTQLELELGPANSKVMGVINGGVGYKTGSEELDATVTAGARVNF